MDIFPKWEHLEDGQYITFVAGSILLDNSGAHLMQTLDNPRRTVVVKGDLGKVSQQYAFLQVRVEATTPVITCRIDPGSEVLPLEPCHRDDLFLLTELCCGMGAWSSVAEKAGYHVVAGVDTNSRWQSLFEAAHPTHARFIAGDCAHPSVVMQLHSLGAEHSTIVAGVNCQPFSSGGDKRGLDDPRSSSLHKVLQTAWVLQSPVVILECVVEVQNDQRFQTVLKQFCASTGYRLTQQSLELADTWCTYRHRWFAVLTAPPIGQCFVPPLPPQVAWKTIGKVMPAWQQWSEEEQQQIQLNLYELNKFHDFVKGGIEKCYVDDSKVLPTCLHSAGNQLYKCRCGCRGPLSLERMADRGLFGVLVPLKTTILHEGIHMREARYLHPAEMYLLNGGDPTISFGKDLRLALAAIGQCVSPIQAVWVLTQVHSAVERFLQIPCRNPLEAVSKHVAEILEARQLIWECNSQEQVAIMEDDPKQECVIPDQSTGTSIRFVASKTAKVADFLKAEQQLNGMSIQMECSPETLLTAVETSLPNLAAQGEKPNHDIPIDEDFVRQGTSLVGLTMPVLLDIVCPLIECPSSCAELKRAMIQGEERKEIMNQQHQIWADDEITWHLNQIKMLSEPAQKVVVWDPLLLSSAVRFGNLTGVSELAKQVCEDATIITAMVVDKHWSPVVWRRVNDQLLTYTCGLPFQFSMAHQTLTNCVAKVMGLSAQPLNHRKLPFLVSTACGALAIAFVKHLIEAEDLPNTFEALQELHKHLRKQFVNSIAKQTSRPWIWGAGEDAKRVLQMLLQEHGVAEQDIAERIQMIYNKIGSTQVGDAMKKPQPWKELKWIANQQTPVVQLIKPSELQAIIAKKAQSGQVVGRKAQKSKTKASLGTNTKHLDPAVLRLESGVFVCGHKSTPLGQIPVNQLGPNVSGVVLCNSDVAFPYLRGGKQISTGGLAMIVLDANQEQLPTQLIAEHVKLPLICTVNSEPVLATGQMFQLGAIPVTKNKNADQFELVTVSTCVAKFAVYRDETDEDWAQVIAHPMRHLFKYVPPLVACGDTECDGSCESWHPNVNYKIEEPVLEVWGRQWLTLQFATVEPSKAEVFMVHVRLPSCLQVQLQSYSGDQGIYLEPKGVDGRSPSEAFQVCWLPRATRPEITILKQTLQHVVGIARMGSKYGVRCQTCHAETVHQEVKPTSSFLPAGKKQFYLIGPMPYGTLKSSIVAAVEGIGWQARPMQPVATSSGEDGVMWKIQSVQPPPKTVISASWGDLVVTRLDDPQVQMKQSPNVVGANRTVQLCSTSKGDRKPLVDPLQQHDPWANFRSSAAGMATDRINTADPIEVLEQKIVSSVMAKLPGTMEVEVDSAAGSSDKIQELENRIEQLSAGQNQLHSMVCEQGQTHGHQIQQLATQTARIENAVADQAGKLTQFQGQFRAQIEHQQTQLDSLFQQQMAKLEELISKKQRTE